MDADHQPGGSLPLRRFWYHHTGKVQNGGQMPKAERRHDATTSRLVEIISDLVAQHCANLGTSPSIDSGCLTANAEAMRELARRGILVIDSKDKCSRQICGHWKRSEPPCSQRDADRPAVAHSQKQEQR